LPLRADLLDEDEPVGTRKSDVPAADVHAPAPAAQAPTGRKGGKKADGGEAASGTKESGQKGRLQAPTPHPKRSRSTGSTTVIPPKHPGAKPVKTNGKGAAEPIFLKNSDRLVGLREKGMVELIGHVVVTQGEMRFEADHAQVFYDDVTKEFSKIVAEGNVKIFGVDENSGEKFKAYGNHAVFMNKERTVVLEGNARLWRGSDSVIRSRKITYELATGWIRADRVAGELSPRTNEKREKSK